MKSLIFAKRTMKEILRDPLSYLFCLAFPLVMLLLMTVINKSIPPEAGMKIFNIEYLAPGIAVFGLTFVMLFTCLQISKDRSTALMNRLYASPMSPVDFIAGYTLPLLLLAIAQSLVCMVAAVIVGMTTDYSFALGNLALCIVTLVPSMLMYIAFGLLFGSLLNDKAAPGISSIIITAVSILGGIWMDIDAMGGAIMKFCQALPFYHGVNAARMAVQGNYSDMGSSLLIVGIYGVIMYLLAVIVLRVRMKMDVK